MHKGGRPIAFPLYRDADIGIDSRNGCIVIDTKTDEDCDSTNSVVNYGIRLCQ
jgi:hypothetical protein